MFRPARAVRAFSIEFRGMKSKTKSNAVRASLERFFSLRRAKSARVLSACPGKGDKAFPRVRWASQREQPALPLGFYKGVDLRNVIELRLFVFPWYFQDGGKVEQAFLYRVGIAPDHFRGIVAARVEFAARHGHVISIEE